MALTLKAFGSSDITDDENSDRRTWALKLCDFLSFPPSFFLPLLLFWQMFELILRSPSLANLSTVWHIKNLCRSRKLQRLLSIQSHLCETPDVISSNNSHPTVGTRIKVGLTHAVMKVWGQSLCFHALPHRHWSFLVAVPLSHIDIAHIGDYIAFKNNNSCQRTGEVLNQYDESISIILHAINNPLIVRPKYLTV